jgi:alkylation response protein AidB-like acyl-CoA dehydrogenase
VSGMAKLVMNEEETMLADMARGFLDDACPVSKLREMRDAGVTSDAATWKEMADLGWAGVLVPE